MPSELRLFMIHVTAVTEAIVTVFVFFINILMKYFIIIPIQKPLNWQASQGLKNILNSYCSHENCKNPCNDHRTASSKIFLTTLTQLKTKKSSAIAHPIWC